MPGVMQTRDHLLLSQAFAFAVTSDYNHFYFWIHYPVAVPVTAGCTNFDFSRQDYFFSHTSS